MSKQQQIETYLLCGNWLTQEKSRILFNDWRLAAIIKRMRDKCIVVDCDLVGDTRHARYSISLKERNRLRKLRISKSKAA